MRTATRRLASIGGSFVSSDIEDYYTDPYELGYGPFIKFDHDFIGAEALKAKQGQPHRKKVTFAWNAEDVAKIFESCVTPGVENFKFIDLPLSNYASSSFDKVSKDGKIVGLSMFSGISWNEKQMLSLGIVDPDVEIGDVLSLTWARRMRHQEDHGRAPQADGDSREGFDRPVRSRRARDLCRRLAPPRADSVSFRI